MVKKTVLNFIKTSTLPLKSNGYLIVMKIA